MSDLRRLAGSLATLGTELEHKGKLVEDRLGGWEPGPEPAPAQGVRGGGGTEADLADRREERRQARRATVHKGEWRTDLKILDDVVQRLFRLIDMACPPDMTELRNRRTGEFEPETAGDIGAAGFCQSCWRNDKQMVPREKTKAGLYYSSTLCRWCLDVKRNYGIEPPLEILKLHHAGRRISTTTMTEAIKAANPGKTKKAKRSKKGKAA